MTLKRAYYKSSLVKKQPKVSFRYNNKVYKAFLVHRGDINFTVVYYLDGKLAVKHTFFNDQVEMLT